VRNVHSGLFHHALVDGRVVRFFVLCVNSLSGFSGLSYSILPALFPRGVNVGADAGGDWTCSLRRPDSAAFASCPAPAPAVPFTRCLVVAKHLPAPCGRTSLRCELPHDAGDTALFVLQRVLGRDGLRPAAGPFIPADIVRAFTILLPFVACLHILLAAELLVLRVRFILFQFSRALFYAAISAVACYTLDRLYRGWFFCVPVVKRHHADIILVCWPFGRSGLTALYSFYPRRRRAVVSYCRMFVDYARGTLDGCALVSRRATPVGGGLLLVVRGPLYGCATSARYTRCYAFPPRCLPPAPFLRILIADITTPLQTLPLRAAVRRDVSVLYYCCGLFVRLFIAAALVRYVVSAPVNVTAFLPICSSAFGAVLLQFCFQLHHLSCYGWQRGVH